MTKKVSEYIAEKWKDYVFLLIEDSYKECEVTGHSMGGPEKLVSPSVSKMKPDGWIKWTKLDNYGENQCSVYCEDISNEMVKLKIYNASDLSEHCYPNYHEFRQEGDEWSSGWYCWGSWSYCHKIRLMKKENLQSEK